MKKIVLLLMMLAFSVAQADISEQEAREIGTEVYIYGYPLVTMEMTRRVTTNVERPEGPRAPMGQFANARKYPTPSFTDITTPNADTLYSTAWLDISKEPYVLHLPDENYRYYLMPLLSGWTDVFADPGTRTTGTGPQDFAITGPHWKGRLPQGMKEFKSPTNLVWILGRTYCTGTAKDFEKVHAIQDQYRLIPLSRWGKSYTPPPGKVDSTIDMKKGVRDQVNNLDAATFFKMVAALMKNNPPTQDDAPIVAKMAKIGMVPGKKFNLNQQSASVIQGLADVPKIAVQKIMSAENVIGTNMNGWHVLMNTGKYGTDYLFRAAVAAFGIGANLPEDALYPFTTVDQNGHLLTGENTYILHFSKDGLPPVKGFWSLTLYNTDYFFVDNPLNRYNLSPRNPLKYNADGSLDLYIQHASPGPEKESNWLPAPEGAFVLMLRLYWPILNDTWKPPAVQKV